MRRPEVSRAQQKMHLVYDEPVVINDRRGDTRDFRVRIWMAKGKPPVVLVESGQDNPCPPHWMSSKLATRIYQTFLRARGGFEFFEIHRDNVGEERFCAVEFEAHGEGVMRRFHRSIPRNVPRHVIETAVGESI